MQLYQSSHHWLLGWRHRRPQEHPRYQEAEQGPGADGQAGPTGLHKLRA